jgi:hypothetical protein
VADQEPRGTQTIDSVRESWCESATSSGKESALSSLLCDCVVIGQKILVSGQGLPGSAAKRARSHSMDMAQGFYIKVKPSRGLGSNTTF